MSIEPDTKDWTWVLERPCPECGFDPAEVSAEDLAELIHQNTRGWYAALDGPRATVRPEVGVWSPLEYACHVRDVHRLFAERLHLMLEQDDPQFANWDQDATAIESRYDEQDPATVSVELVEAAADAAAVYAGVDGDQWHRPGRRSNGSVFTVETLGVYHLHDVVHHLHDIGAVPTGDPRSETIAAYDADVAAYAAGTATLPESVARDIDDFVKRVGAGARVLEIGSGPGRDAGELERRGTSVRRTDVTPGFVDLMRADGHEADVVDPLVDDLGGPYDGVWANAVLIHLARDQMGTVLARLHDATRPGGTLYASVQEGDGEAWVSRGHVSGARHFTFWREQPFRDALEAAGWRVDVLRRSQTANGSWLDVFAGRT